MGQDTVFPSIQLAIEDVSGLLGTCDAGYSCVYINTVSWATPTQPLPMQINPRVVFEQMFGGAGTPEQRRVRMQENRSILDSVFENSKQLESGLGPRDRARMSDYLENIREIEQRIQRAESRTDELVAVAPESPVGIPESYEEHVRLLYDLLYVAFQADISRFFTFMMGRELSHQSYPQVGVADPHHSISHHQNSRQRR